jgi:molybdopterin converting factor small subunit
LETKVGELVGKLNTNESKSIQAANAFFDQLVNAVAERRKAVIQLLEEGTKRKKDKLVVQQGNLVARVESYNQIMTYLKEGIKDNDEISLQEKSRARTTLQTILMDSCPIHR